MKPIKDFQQLQYLASMDSALNIVKSWLDAKPENKELQELAKGLMDISVYVSGLELERRGFDNIVSELRSGRNRAVIRARKSEETKEIKKPDLTHLIAP
jgi:hypothetical protein